ncbi:hypothetical protein VN12_05505 [Pirellula sp. SH-Sr6A]|uniref:hypothetical protein n=1 Tax=Pirellula sp. SH-Sr6A TaxID=1632865 RepID=UPI00078E4F6E|nr:hypothetical protein [Pirellula sp. SH-Sr6A]AMV31554.1 hypothetical protein VN12_05505 [Pirellula sp. SH-Sr6A]
MYRVRTSIFGLLGASSEKFVPTASDNPTRLQSSLRAVQSFSFLGELSSLAILYLWLLSDGYLTHLVLFADTKMKRFAVTDEIIQPRYVGVIAILIVFSVSWLFHFAINQLGVQSGSGIRRMLLQITTLAAGLSIWMGWCSIVDFGRQLRFSKDSAAIERFAVFVDSQWKVLVAGESPLVVGPSNPYPLYEPTLLIYSNINMIPDTEIAFVAIERTSQEAIRFELSGSNLGRWLEIRFTNDPPGKFIGGIESHFTPLSYRKLSDRIFLVEFAES